MISLKVKFTEPLTNVRWRCGEATGQADPLDSSAPHATATMPGSAGANSTRHEAESQGTSKEGDLASDQMLAAQYQMIIDLQQTILDRLEELEQRRRASLEEMQQLAVEIATAMASRIVHDKVEAGELPFGQLIHSAVERFDRNMPLSVYLNPVDLKQWQETLEKQTIPALAPTVIRLIGDRQLPRGGCRTDNGSFSLLFDWEAQLDEIREHLKRSLHEAEIERRQDSATDLKLGRFPDRRETA
jgi:flagellar biosynthesis/type III secretory pathway protein FliH